MSLTITTQQEEPVTRLPIPTILVSDKDDSTSLESGFGSNPDFHSQAELCPNYVKQRKPSQDIEERKCDPEKVKEYTGVKRYGGMLLTIPASICFSFVTLMVKVLTTYGIDAYSISFWRYLGIVLPTISILIFCECGPGGRSMREKGLKKNLKPGSVFDSVWPVLENENWKTWIFLFSRGLLGSTAVILRYYSLAYMSIGDSSVIANATPVLVTVMAHFCLGERCRVVSVVVAFTTLLGVIIVLRPPLITGATEFDADTLFGTILASGSLFCSSLTVIITRKIREVHFALMILVFGIMGVTQAAILAYTVGHGHIDVPTGLEYSLLVGGVAFLSFFGQIAIVLALKFEQAGPITLLRSSDIILGFLLQFIFLKVVPDKYSAIGGSIVMVGVAIVASRKWISSLPDGGWGKRYFSWILR